MKNQVIKMIRYIEIWQFAASVLGTENTDIIVPRDNREMVLNYLKDVAQYYWDICPPENSVEDKMEEEYEAKYNWIDNDTVESICPIFGNIRIHIETEEEENVRKAKNSKEVSLGSATGLLF